MARRQRRIATKPSRHAKSEPWDTGEERPVEKPGFLLRLFATIALAPWVLNRVSHAEVERLLAQVAVQTGRPEVARNLVNRIAMRKETRR